ncbi:MAG TPA: hypothetical protein VIH76_19080 [Candidatus Acidoferrales bacterium]
MALGGSAIGAKNVKFSSKYTRYLIVPLALAALLVITTTLGNVWHHHDSNSETTCPICHFNHQPIEKPLAGNRLPVLMPISSNPDVSHPSLELAPDPHCIPARAPPSA